MTGNASLASRLVAHWIVASLLVFFTLPVTVYIPFTLLHVGFNADANLEEWTCRRALDVLIDALAKTPDGSPIIDETEALSRHERRNPEFQFAVINAETGAVLSKSSPALAAFAKAPNQAGLIVSIFHIPGDPNPKSRGLARTRNTPYGKMTFLVYGAYFHWDDLLYTLYVHVTLQSAITYLVIAAAIALVGYVSVRFGLAPLRAAAAQAAAIDADSLNQRIPVADMPSEVLPFVNAMNNALERVDNGVARQRRFTANAAHELRTPIAILRARVDKLEDAPLKEDIKRDVRRIQTIVDQLLVLAQLKERKAFIEEVFDLNEVVLTIAADYMPIAIDNRRQIAFEAPPGPVTARGNRWAVESVVTNLVENAVRAEPLGGTVVIRVGVERVIEIVDHGAGVEPKDREAVFEPFWRKDDRVPGTGLGLSIVRELVNALGGKISNHETPGGGATFSVTLGEMPRVLATETIRAETIADPRRVESPELELARSATANNI